MAARTATNKLLCDIMIAPDRGVVVIEDAGAQGITGIYIQSGIDPEPAPVQQAVVDGTLICADRLVAAGQRSQAIAMIEGLTDASQPEHVRGAAKRMLSAVTRKS